MLPLGLNSSSIKYETEINEQTFEVQDQSDNYLQT